MSDFRDAILAVGEAIEILVAQRDALQAAIEWVVQCEYDNTYRSANVFLGQDDSGKPILHIQMSDTFFYASADAEEIPWEEVVELRARIEAEGWPAGVRWAAKRRNCEPIPEIAEAMIKYDLENNHG